MLDTPDDDAPTPPAHSERDRREALTSAVRAKSWNAWARATDSRLDKLEEEQRNMQNLIGHEPSFVDPSGSGMAGVLRELRTAQAAQIESERRWRRGWAIGLVVLGAVSTVIGIIAGVRALMH